MAPGLVEKFRGALLGTALGDAIGAGWEGWIPVPESTIAAAADQAEQLRYTDDTAMTIGVAESLAERGGFDGDHMSKQLLENFRRDPGRGYGQGPTKVFAKLARGESWRTAAEGVFPGGSYGNGAAMRAAPLGLFYHDIPEEELRSLAYEMAHITHTHPLGKEGAALQAYAVVLATRADPAQDLDRDEFVGLLAAFARADVYRQKVARIATLLSRPDRRQVAQQLGRGVQAPNSVPTAIFCFLLYPKDFRRAILYAAGLGGDTDTIAAMTGAVSGAYLGSPALPKNWLDKLEDQQRITQLADALYAAYQQRKAGKA